MNFGPSARRLLGRLKPERAGLIGVILLGVLERAARRARPEDPRRGDQHHLRGRHLEHASPPASTQDRSSPSSRRAATSSRPTSSRGLTLHPGQGIDFDALALVLGIVLLLYVLSSVFSWLQGYVLNGIMQRTVLPPARGGRGEDPPPAAELLRQDAARRAAQPRDERHRQHLADPAADAEPAAHLAADRRRRADHDVRRSRRCWRSSRSSRSRSRSSSSVLIAKRSQKLFVAQWTHTGAPERARSRRATPATRWSRSSAATARSRARFADEERGALQGQLRRPVHQRA